MTLYTFPLYGSIVPSQMCRRIQVERCVEWKFRKFSIWSHLTIFNISVNKTYTANELPSNVRYKTGNPSCHLFFTVKVMQTLFCMVYAHCSSKCDSMVIFTEFLWLYYVFSTSLYIRYTILHLKSYTVFLIEGISMYLLWWYTILAFTFDSILT